MLLRCFLVIVWYVCMQDDLGVTKEKANKISLENQYSINLPMCRVVNYAECPECECNDEGKFACPFNWPIKRTLFFCYITIHISNKFIIAILSKKSKKKFSRKKYSSSLIIKKFWQIRSIYSCSSFSTNGSDHGLRTPNEGINDKNLKIWADVATKYALAVPKNLRVGVDFRPISEGDFFSG